MSSIINTDYSSLKRPIENPNSPQFTDDAIIQTTQSAALHAIQQSALNNSSSKGITEEFTSSDAYFNTGTRTFPDGKKEKGKFNKETGKFVSGYRIETDGNIEFIHPDSLLSYEKEGKDFIIFDFEGKLIVLKKINYSTYQPANIPVETILLSFTQRGNILYENKSIKSVLEHASFKENLENFITNVLAPDESGTPRLFSLSNHAAVEVIEIGSKTTNLDPSTIIDPISGKDFITHIAASSSYGNENNVNKLIELFPKEFLSVGQSVIAEMIKHKNACYMVKSVVEKFNELGGVLDTFHTLWLQVIEPSLWIEDGELGLEDVNQPRNTDHIEAFEKEFSSLSVDQKEALYDSAFDYNNSFVLAPSEIPVTADQYSINLMWINKNKIPDSQEFLFGTKKSFHKEFVEPISIWAKKNPESVINIWVDSKMASKKAIEQSEMAILDSLKEIPHGKIQFRDVRDIDTVKENPAIFTESIPVYFRVDLLRAIAADYTLRNKETKYFVYSDIDVDALSTQEIFDKRTVNSLNDFGLVMANSPKWGFENSFQIFNGENSTLMASHRKVIIDLSIEVAKSKQKEIDQQQIYNSYRSMITHFLAADGRYGKLVLPEIVTKNRNYQLNNDWIFRYDCFKNWATANHLPFESEDHTLKNTMPRKAVRVPPSRFDYSYSSSSD